MEILKYFEQFLNPFNALKKAKNEAFWLFFILVHRNCLIFVNKINLGNTYTLEILNFFEQFLITSNPLNPLKKAEKWGFLDFVYRKPTSSGVYTNYSSFLPEIYDSGLIRTLIFRLYTICFSWSPIHLEIEHLRTVMRRNPYPDTLIDNAIKRFLAHLFAENVPSTETKTFQLYLS